MSFFREVSHLMKWRITILSLSRPYRNMSLVFRLRNVKAAFKRMHYLGTFHLLKAKPIPPQHLLSTDELMNRRGL